MDELAFFIGFLSAFLLVLFGYLYCYTPQKQQTFESNKPLVPDTILTKTPNGVDTLYIYHHPSYYKK